MQLNITDNTDLNRFEMKIDDQIAFIEYETDYPVLYLTHAEVPEDLRGEGNGNTLIKNVLEYLKGKELTIVAECPAVKQFVIEHDGYNYVTVD